MADKMMIFTVQRTVVQTMLVAAKDLEVVTEISAHLQEEDWMAYSRPKVCQGCRSECKGGSVEVKLIDGVATEDAEQTADCAVHDGELWPVLDC